MSELSFGSGFICGWFAASLCMVVSGAIYWWRKDARAHASEGEQK